MMKVMTVVEGGDGGWWWVDGVVLCCGVQGKSPQRERKKKERRKRETETKIGSLQDKPHKKRREATISDAILALCFIVPN